MLPILYQQHYQYTTELGQTHQALSKLYKKLAKVERVLAERQDRGLTRADRKKWQYTRALSKRAVANLENKQLSLHDHLRQCNNLIASYEQGASYDSASSTQMPPSPYMFTPYSPVDYAFWPFTPHKPGLGGPDGLALQYWDLSMLRETSPSTAADSGYHEGLLSGQDSDGTVDVTSHVLALDVVSPFNPSAAPFENSQESRLEEKDNVSELKESLGSAQVGAESPNAHHKRGYSVDAVQSNLGLLATPSKMLTTRATSVGPVPARKKAREPNFQE